MSWAASNFYAGRTLQEMAGWPGYWEGLPPMHYATHCVSPCLALPGKLAESVVCHGSGRISRSPDFQIRFALRGRDRDLENARFRVVAPRSPAACSKRPGNISRAFDVYADKVSFEWPSSRARAGRFASRRKTREGRNPRLCQPSSQGFAALRPRGVYDANETQHLSFLQGSGHGGSHPHLAHEFITAVVEARRPRPDAETSANRTMTGISPHVGHERRRAGPNSAVLNGEFDGGSDVRGGPPMHSPGIRE